MGRRNSGSFRMGLRGKPALILLCFVVLVIFVVLYFRRPSSALKYEPISDHHNHKNSFNLGSNKNFDPQKFIVKAPKAEKLKEYNDQPVEKNNGDKLLDLDINKKIKQNNVKNLNEKYLNSPIRNRPNLNNGNELNDDGNIKEKFGKALQKLDKITDPEIQNSRTEIEKLYSEPDVNSPVDFKGMKHIVHLDLKGAAPKLEYFEQILPVIKNLGATGLLVEYEDMFPYEGKLSSIPAGNALSKPNLVKFLQLAQELNLEIIPLIQTFGHMEFILKLEEFSSLRESADTPQVIAPGVNETYTLLQTLIDQIITNHPTSKYIHLGCDEVYELGKGRSAEYMMKKNLKRSDMFFEHVSRIVMYVKQKYLHITPIIWDDEFRHESVEMIQKFGLGNILEPMIWSYQPNPRNKFSDDMWEKYGKAFKNVWAASSFKGATGSSQYYTNITHHMSNHLAWIDIILEAKKIAPKMKFRGVTLTGWQRYDHFATLCELLPSAIPTLSLCLTTIGNGGFTQADHEHIQNVLGCSDKALSKCTFPGNDLYALILSFKEMEDCYKANVGLQSRLNGWLTDYNIKHGFGSPGQLKVLEIKINQTRSNYTSIRIKLEKAILKYYDQHTADEWISVHVDQQLKFLSEKFNEAEKLIKVKIFSKRPLVSKYNQVPIIDAKQNQFKPPLGGFNNPHPNLQSAFQSKGIPNPKQSFEFKPESYQPGLQHIQKSQNKLLINKLDTRFNGRSNLNLQKSNKILKNQDRSKKRISRRNRSNYV